MKVLFKTDTLQFEADFNDSLTAREIIKNFPLSSTISTWGDEIYFDIGFKASAQGATMDLKVGDIGYWPQGKCLCVFFGPTPNSTSEDPAPASPVVIVGKTKALKNDLKNIQLGEAVTVSV